MVRLAGLIALICLLWMGCTDDADEDEGLLPDSEIPSERQGTIAARRGYLDGKAVEYYRLGSLVPSTASGFPPYETFGGHLVSQMVIVAPSGEPLGLTSGQRPIIDLLPRQSGATDFFELVRAIPDGDYEPDAVKSRATLVRLGFTLEATGLVVNCPVVGQNASLATPKGTSRAIFKIIEVWYRKKLTRCALLDGGIALQPGGAPAIAVYRNPITSTLYEYRVPAVEVYALRTKAFGGADQVTGIPVPNNDIFRYGPGNALYSPLAQVWDVDVPSDYKVGAKTSYSALFPVLGMTDPAIVKRNPDMFFNDTLITASGQGAP